MGISLGPLAAAVLLLSASPALAVPEEEVGASLSEQGNVFLRELLGPGRARVCVRVQGEQSELLSRTRLSTDGGARPKAPLPSFTDGQTKAAQAPAAQDREEVARLDSFNIRRIEATLVADERLPQADVERARRALSEFLKLDSSRGDELRVLKMSLAPRWKSVWLTEDGLRWLGLAGAVAAAALLLFLATVWWLSRLGRGLVSAIAGRRAAGAGPPLIGPAREDIPRMVTVEALVSGTPDPAPAPPAGPARFDFLREREPKEVAAMLQGRPARDVALFFGGLAVEDAGLACSIFESLPEALQLEASRLLLRLRSPDAGRLSRLEEELRSELGSKADGLESLGAVVGRLPAGRRGALLQALSAADPKGSSRLEDFLKDFPGA